MKRFSLTFLSVFALAFFLSAQSDVTKSGFKSGVIQIDGNDQEWDKPYQLMDDNTGLKYAISNDKQNLYLVFSVNDVMKMRKLMHAGWTIELSSKEKKRKFTASLIFPEVLPAGQGYHKGSNEKENRAEMNLMIKEYASELPGVSLKGFLNGATSQSLNSKKDVRIAVDANPDQELVYELAIPLNELMPEELIQGTELISMNVSENGMQHPSGGGEHPHSGGGGMGEGGGGYSGGGHSGGHMGGGGHSGGGHSGGGHSGGSNGSGNYAGMAEKASFNLKFELSPK